MRPRLGFVFLLPFLACQPPPDRETLHSQLPNRPYSQVVRVGDTYYFAGKTGDTDSTRVLTTGRTGAETRVVMESFRELFDELGLRFEDVVKATVYLTDLADYDEMNQVYGVYFPENPPARETVAVAALVGGARIEISFVAVRSLR